MKKSYLTFLTLALLVIPSLVWGATAGVCTQALEPPERKDYLIVTLRCTANSGDGSIPNQSIDISGITDREPFYLYQVIAKPTPGGTAPDAADIAVYMEGVDLLGGKGVNLIHATDTQDTFPYSTFMTSYRFPLITGPLTLTIANQATNSANFVIKLLLVK